LNFPFGLFSRFALRTLKRELQQSNRRSTANPPRYSCAFVCIRVHSWFTNTKCRERLQSFLPLWQSQKKPSRS